MVTSSVSFFKKLAILVLPFALFLGFVEYRLREIPNSYNQKRQYLESQLDEIEVLVLGASQSLDAINPTFFSCNGFNLSNVSQSIFYDTRLTLKYIDRMSALKYVIVSISYYSLWFQLHDTQEHWRDYYYYHFWGIKYPELRWYDPKLYSLIMVYSPETARQFAINRFKVDLAQDLDRSGWLRIEPVKNNPNISAESGKKRVALHDKYRFPFRFSEIYSLLDSFVRECKTRGIDVVVITTPVLSTYFSRVNPAIVQKNTEAVEKICQEHGCQYFDYFRDDRFTKDDFADNDHMNRIGAEKFSRILDADIVSKIQTKVRPQ